MLNSSTAAGTDPSRRKRTFAGGVFGKVSGTSKTPLVIDSLRPPDMSTLPRPILTTAVRPEMCRLTSASRMAGRPSTGRISPPCPVSWISKPSSGTGGPLDLSVDQGALVEMSMRSIVPAWTWSTTQARTFEATVTGHSRFMAATDMRVLANPSVTRGSSPEKSRLPVSAMPRSVLPTSLGSRSMRCLAGLIRIRSRTRLRTSACGSTGADASTAPPPEICSPQMPLPSRGDSNCASSVMRVPPETTWNGATSARRLLSQSRLISARSIGTRTSGSSRSTMRPFSTTMRPSSMYGMPSGPTSARMRPDSGRSASY